VTTKEGKVVVASSVVQESAIKENKKVKDKV
jgi:hypothetical protein